MRFVTLVDRINQTLGTLAGGCALVMLLAQVFSVVTRYAFGYGIIAVQESVIYAHATMFLLGAGLVLRENGHVRVDVFYSTMSQRARHIVDLVGLTVFVMPVAGVIFWLGLPYVARSWATLEGSRQSGGLPAVFLLKTMLLVFAVSVALQAIAILIRLFSGDLEQGWKRADGHG
ncbi:MAG: TRAP transporter small permease subunit [Rhodobiaceae bacterium]|nr:TRAP transporter small permease subunit [Rhodobiaceae bacterium]